MWFKVSVCGENLIEKSSQGREGLGAITQKDTFWSLLPSDFLLHLSTKYGLLRALTWQVKSCTDNWETWDCFFISPYLTVGSFNVSFQFRLFFFQLR